MNVRGLKFAALAATNSVLIVSAAPATIMTGAGAVLGTVVGGKVAE